MIPSQFPSITWQVGLIIGQTTLCGGAILNSTFIITAAHCVKNIYSDVVRSPSSIDIRPGISLYPAQGIVGKAIWVHPSYTSSNIPNYVDIVDLAIIETNIAFTFTQLISGIALPRASALTPPPNGYIVSGYGTTVSDNTGQSVLSSNLLHVSVPWVSYISCDAAAPFTVPTGSVCAGGVQGKDSCQGDSGGALVANVGTVQSPSFVLVGIVSSGTSVQNPLCAVASEYGIYVDVRKSLSWIDDVFHLNVRPNSVATKKTLSLLLFLFILFLINL